MDCDDVLTFRRYVGIHAKGKILAISLMVFP